MPRAVPVWTLLCAVVLAVACGTGTRVARPSSVNPAAVAAGRALFTSSHCGGCHALAAAGAHGDNGPNLDTSEKLDLGQLRVGVLGGANGMPSYRGRLSAREVDELAAFLLVTTRGRGRG